jgi:hypothetical protein
MVIWTGLKWLRVEYNGGFPWTSISGFHTSGDFPEQLGSCRERPFINELVMLRVSLVWPSGLFRCKTNFWNYESFQHFGGTPWTWDWPIPGLYLHSTVQHRKREPTSMLRTGFEPTIPVFERPETTSTLDERGHWDRLVSNVRVIN